MAKTYGAGLGITSTYTGKLKKKEEEKKRAQRQQQAIRREKVAENNRGKSYKIGVGYVDRPEEQKTGSGRTVKSTYNHLQMVNPTEYNRQQSKNHRQTLNRTGTDTVTQAERKVDRAEVERDNYKAATKNLITEKQREQTKSAFSNKSWSEMVSDSKNTTQQTLAQRKQHEAELDKKVNRELENFNKADVEYGNAKADEAKNLKETNKREYYTRAQAGLAKLSSEDFDKIFKFTNGEFKGSVEHDNHTWQELQDLINEASQNYSDDLANGQMTNPDYQGNPELLREVNNAQMRFDEYKNETSLYTYAKKKGLLDDLGVMLSDDNVNVNSVLRKFEEMLNAAQAEDEKKMVEATFSKEAFSEKGLENASRYNREFAKTFGLTDNEGYRRFALGAMQVANNTFSGTQEGIRSFANTVVSAYQNQNSDIAERHLRADPNSGAYSYQRIQNQLNTMYTDGVDEVTAFFMNMGVEAANMLLGAQAFGGAYTATMGLQAAGQTSYETVKKGGNYEQAAFGGTVAGAAAYVMETIGMDNMFAAWESAGRASSRAGIKSIAKAFAASAMAEGLEEVGEEVINMVADFAMMGDKSDMAQYIKEYIEANPDSTQAEVDAAQAMYIWSRLGQSFLGGAFLGGPFGASIGMSSYLDAKFETKAHHEELNKVGSEIRAKEGALDDLIKSVGQTAPNSTANKVLGEIQAKQQNGEEITDHDIGKLNEEVNKNSVLETQANNFLLGRGSEKNLSTETKQNLYDPRNADFNAKKYGVDINSSMTPKQIRQVLLNENKEQNSERTYEAQALSVVKGMNELESMPQAVQDRLLSGEDFETLGITPQIGETNEQAIRRVAAENVKKENRVSFEDYKAPNSVVVGDNLKGIYRDTEKATGKKVLVADIEGKGYATGDKIVISSKIATTEEGARFVLSHEITHGTELSKHYRSLVASAKTFYKENGWSWEDSIIQMMEDRAKEGHPVSVRGAEAEMVANFVGNNLFTDVNQLKTFVENHRTAARRLMSWLRTKLLRIGAVGEYRSETLMQAYENFERAFNEINRTSKGVSDIAEHQRKLNSDTRQNLFTVETDAKKIAEAEALEKEGKSAVEIWKTAHVFRDAEGYWRKELDDYNVTVKDEFYISDNSDLRKFEGKEYSLADVLDIPYDDFNLGIVDVLKYGKLFKDITVKFEYEPDESADAHANVGKKIITVNTAQTNVGDGYELTITLLHELQHIMQRNEGLIHGYSPSGAGIAQEFVKSAQKMGDVVNDSSLTPREKFDRVMADVENRLNPMSPWGERMLYWDRNEALANGEAYGETVVNQANHRHYQNYKGEKEAFTTEIRHALKGEERYEDTDFLENNAHLDVSMTEDEVEDAMVGILVDMGFDESNAASIFYDILSSATNAPKNLSEVQQGLYDAIEEDPDDYGWGDRQYSASDSAPVKANENKLSLDEMEDVLVNKFFFKPDEAKALVLDYAQGEDMRSLLEEDFDKDLVDEMLEGLGLSESRSNLKGSSAQYSQDDSAPVKAKVDNKPTPDDLISTKTKGAPNYSKAEKKRIRQENLDTLNRKFVDSLSSWGGVDKQIGGDSAVYKAADNARRAAQAADFSIGKDITGQEAYQADYLGRRVGKSLNDIWSPIYKAGQEVRDDFEKYLRLMDHLDRIPLGTATLPSYDGSGNVMSEREAKTLIKQLIRIYDGYFSEQTKDGEIKYGFAKIAKEVWKYNHNNLRLLLESGNLTYDEYATIKGSHKHYVPAYRDLASLPGGTKEAALKGVKRSTGEHTGLPFLPIDDMMARQTRGYILAARKNQMINALADAYEQHGDKIGNFVYDLSPSAEKSEQKEATTMEDIEDAYDPDETGLVQEDPSNITFFRNGEKRVIKVSDGIMEGYRSLTSKTAWWEKPLQKIGNTYRMWITNYNPTFLATNFFKDFGDAIFYSQDTAKFVKNYVKNIKHMKENSPLWQLYKANGGFNSSFFEASEGMAKKHNAVQRMTIDKIEAANMFVEQAPRFAEFRTSLELQGAIDKHGNIIDARLTPKVLQKAMYDAADITVNFGRSGTITRKVNRDFVPFLNASVQGFAKFTRQFQQHGGKAWGRLAVKAALIGVLPAVLNSLMYGDDDEFKHMTDWNRDNNYMFKLGDGKWLAIPRGRLMSFFAGLGNRAVRAYKGDEVRWDSLAELVKTNIAPANPIDSNILAPIIRVANNENWYGGSIDSYEDLQKRPEDRYDESTSSLFKGLGKILGQSPKRLQDLFESYTGFIGDVVVPMTNKKAESPLDSMTSKFIKDAAYSNDFSSTFRAYKDELDQLVMFEGDSDVTTELGYKQKYLNQQSKIIAELYDAISDLENSNKPDAQKREEARALRYRITAAYESAVNNAELLEKALDKYYKVDTNADVKIQQRQADEAYAKAMCELFGSREGLKAFGLNDEKLDEIKDSGISLNDYYAYYSKTRSGDKYYSLDENGKSQSYTVSEKKQLLIDTVKDDSAIAKIYEYEFENDSKKDFNTMAYAVKHGVRASAYIKRELQAADEEGDKSGETKKNYYIENGKVYYEETDKWVSGSKLVKAMHNMLNSGYTDSELEYFYQKEYGSDDKFVWFMQSGLSAKDYLEYREATALITADKDENGNSISGSKKQKIFDAINSLHMSKMQKLMLFMRDYTLSSSQYREVFDYINSLSLSRDEKLALAEGLGFKIENGKVYMKKAS